MTNKIALTITAAFALAGAASQASALTNISFEDGLNGWTSATGVTTPSSIFSGAGDLMALLTKGSNGNLVLSQFGGSALGAGYTLFYDLTSTPATGNWYKVRYTTATGSPSWTDLVSQTNSGDSGSVAIPTGTTGLEFTLHRGAGTPSVAFDVSPVPEPGEWAMMLAGFGLIGFMVKRRRHNSAV
jgi:hypothetical protein